MHGIREAQREGIPSALSTCVWLVFCATATLAQTHGKVKEQDEAGKQVDMQVAARLDEEVARCWREYNFSTVSPGLCRDAAAAYRVTRTFDHLELAAGAQWGDQRRAHRLGQLSRTIDSPDGQSPHSGNGIGRWLPCAERGRLRAAR